MYLIPGEDEWTLVINKNVTAGSKYDEGDDLVRAPMQTESSTRLSPFRLRSLTWRRSSATSAFITENSACGSPSTRNKGDARAVTSAAALGDSPSKKQEARVWLDS